MILLRRLTVPDVLPLVRAYLDKPGNSVGGSLHIVLSDANIEDHHVEWCREWAIDHDDADGEHLATVLLLMTKTQRLKIAAVCWQRPRPSDQLIERS